MSIGGVVGAVIGGVVGFFIGGGPMGALYGASIGFSIGMMVDPMTPDIPTPGTPLPAGAEIMPATIGDPISDLLGTAKITGHLLCFGKERTVTLTAESEGGKGGTEPDPYVTGYEYYMSWVLGIVKGQVDTLYTIYNGENVVWEGELNVPTIPGSYGQETITLEGMGSATFYFGTDDQVANSKVGEIIGDDTLNSPNRHFCWCFFDDCYIGKFNRCPTMKFVLKKTPEIAFSEHNEIQTYDYNPIHAIWYIFHDLAGLPETWLHSDDFTAAALTMENESRGICCLFDRQQNTLNYLESINNHIDGIIRYGSDGKFHPKLIREDYVIDDLPVINEDVLLDDPTLNRKSWIDTINEVKVQYTNIARLASFPQGEWVAAMSHTSFIYLYDITYKSVIKINTLGFPVFCQDTLPITEYYLDYGMGFSAAQHGGYCMNKDGTRLWYLIKNGLDCQLVEVDITGYTMKIVKSTILPSLLTAGERINDGCSDNTHTYWCTTDITGRIIKIRNSDHVIIKDENNFSVDPINPCTTDQAGINSIDTYGGALYWNFVRSALGCSPPANACAYWNISSTETLGVTFTTYGCGSGLHTPQWQNMLRIFDGSVYIHRAYHPSYGNLVKTGLDYSYTVDDIIQQQYLQNMLGVYKGNLFTIMHPNSASPPLYLYCIDSFTMDYVYSKNVVEYSNHAVSAMSTYVTTKILSLFYYDVIQTTNIITCFSANASLTTLYEDDVKKIG